MRALGRLGIEGKGRWRRLAGGFSHRPMGCEAIPESWRPVLEPVLATREARRLGGWLRAEEEGGKSVYPPRGSRLRAFELTPLETVRVVILGQDPYHGPGQAMG